MLLDGNTETLLKFIHEDVAERFRIVANELFDKHGLSIRMTEGLRTFKTQADYYSRGRSNVNGFWEITEPDLVITHALPGQSLHQYGLAFDVCFKGSDPYPKDETVWEKYGDELKNQGLTWGGVWVGPKNDRPHGEDKFGFTIKQLHEIYLKTGTLLPVWDACSSRIKGR